MTKLIANIFVTNLNVNISVNTFVTKLKYQVRGSSSESCSQSGAFMVVKDKGDKEDSDYEDAASQENARDPVLEVMLTVAGPNYSAWTRTDITGADPKTIMKPLTLIGGEKWLEQLSTDKNISSDMLTHLQKI